MTKRRKRRPDKAGEGYPPLRVGPRKRTVRYVEEAAGHPLAGRCNAVGAHSTTDDFGAAVENLCIVRASIGQAPRPHMEYNQDTETSISRDWKGLSGVGCKAHPDSQGGDLEWAPLQNLKPILGREERT